VTFSSGQWAYEDRLIDLSDEIRPFASLFDPDALAAATLFDAATGRRALYALPVGFSSNHVHVWRNRPNILRSCQRVEQRLSVRKVGRFEALGEPAVDRREQVVRFLPLAVLRPQAGEARGCA
jgi:hypothetical protein